MDSALRRNVINHAPTPSGIFRFSVVWSMPNFAVFCPSEASDERKMRKTAFPRPRMSGKREKLHFRGLGWAKNRKNCISEASDERKTRKTAFPRPRMSKKREKLHFRGLGWAKNAKNSVSEASDERKTRFFNENSRRELRNRDLSVIFQIKLYGNQESISFKYINIGVR